MTLKISISGVRGHVPDGLTPEICLNFAKAFGTYLLGGKIVVGADPRQSSEFIKGIIFSGLLSAGCKVIDLGVAPTPTVGIMTRELKAAGGIIITASHNPLPWNGLKFLRGDGIFLNESQGETLLKIFRDKAFASAPGRGVSGNYTGIATHIKRVLRTVNPLAIKLKRFKVAVDCCNGAGSIALVKLLAKLGCQVFPLNCSLALPFPHPPEPVAENLSDLCQLVTAKKADIGMAVDSDADRLALVSEEGKAIGEELTLALVEDFLLSKNRSLAPKKRIVVTNLSTSKVIDDIGRKYGATVIRTKIGEVNVTEELKALKGLIGGEGNGGVIFPRVGFNRDSLAGAALVLNLLSATGKKVSELVKGLPAYEMVKAKIECHNTDEVNDLLLKVKAIFKGQALVLTDGVKVLLPDGWVHARASNTEPVIRVIAESTSKQKAEELVNRILK